MNTKQAENGLLQELLREMKNIKNDLNEFRSETECRLEEIERFQQRADAGIARAEKQINEFRFETESKFREISKINRRLKDIERDQPACRRRYSPCSTSTSDEI